MSSAICKIFELVIAEKCEESLATLSLQFGRRQSTAPYCAPVWFVKLLNILVLEALLPQALLPQALQYIVFLDVSKTFDRVHHDSL